MANIWDVRDSPVFWTANAPVLPQQQPSGFSGGYSTINVLLHLLMEELMKMPMAHQYGNPADRRAMVSQQAFGRESPGNSPYLQMALNG